jgi:hypothetical protein
MEEGKHATWRRWRRRRGWRREEGSPYERGCYGWSGATARAFEARAVEVEEGAASSVVTMAGRENSEYNPSPFTLHLPPSTFHLPPSTFHLPPPPSTFGRRLLRVAAARRPLEATATAARARHHKRALHKADFCKSRPEPLRRPAMQGANTDDLRWGELSTEPSYVPNRPPLRTQPW